MKLALVPLDNLKVGSRIVSNVCDPLGRLLVVAPVTLDEFLKKKMLDRGVRGVFIEERREGIRIPLEELVDDETAKVSLRLLNLNSTEKGRDLKKTIEGTISRFYKDKVARNIPSSPGTGTSRPNV